MVSIPKQSGAIGRVLAGRYRVEGVLGRGAMGSVYRALDQENNRVCAIKLMHQYATMDDRAYMRFVHEAQIVAQLYHPNIVQVYGFDRDEDGTPILAMELLEGVDLHTLITNEPRQPLPRTLEILKAVGGALHAAHNHGVLHRDIKPKNIFLSRQKNSRGDDVETVKVVDFGLSKVLGMHHANETAPGTILGTAEYVAPEATLGMPELIDFRVDQWALGVVAYRMLAGRLPFEAPDVITLLLTIRQAEPKPLRDLVKDVPKHIIAAVERSMAKNKDERFETMQDFLRALEGLPPVGHVLSKSSDGLPAVAASDRSRRNPTSSPSNSGRISLSGAHEAPSSTSARHANSSASGRMAARPASDQRENSSPSDPSGRLKAPAVTSSINDDFAALGAVLGVAAPTPVAPAKPVEPVRQPIAAAGRTAQFAPFRDPKPSEAPGEKVGAHAPVSTVASAAVTTGRAQEPSAEYSMHVSGQMKGPTSQPTVNPVAPAKKRGWTTIMAPLGILLLGGLGWLLVPRHAAAPLGGPSTSAPVAAPASAPPPAVNPAAAATPALGAPALDAPALVPGLVPAPLPPTSASPSPPVLAAPVAPTPAPAAVAVHPPVLPPTATASKPGLAPHPQPAQWNRGVRPAAPGNWHPGVHPVGKVPQPAGATMAAPAPAQPAASNPGVDARPAEVAGHAPAPVAAPPPAAPVAKEADPPKRITVVD